MSEYIITDKQLKTATEAYLERELSRPITEVFVSGDKLPEIVRCRDCKHYDESDAGCSYFVLAKNKLLHIGNPDGFCAWGERR